MAIEHRMARFLDVWESDQREGRSLKGLHEQLVTHVEEDREAFRELRKDIKDLGDDVRMLLRDRVESTGPITPRPRGREQSSPGVVVNVRESAPSNPEHFDIVKVAKGPAGKGALLLIAAGIGWVARHFGFH